MQTAQDYLDDSRFYPGFNSRLQGYSYLDTFSYPHERSDPYRQSGWDRADEMIASGKIYSMHNFHKSHGNCPRGFAFLFGGFWVCNGCNNQGVDKPWWVIKVFQDGGGWCCVGENFINLGESDNYAFGDTREEAIKNYGDLHVST